MSRIGHIFYLIWYSQYRSIGREWIKPMKKLALFFLISCSMNIFAVTLDELISELESEGYSKEFRELEIKDLDIEEKKIYLIDRDGIEVRGSSSYLDDSSGREFDSSISTKYDIFKYQGSYNHEAGETERELIGVEKNLKDIFYSERSYRTNVFQYEREYRLNLEKERLENDIVGVIDLYRSYMDTLLELRLKNQLLPGLESEYEAIKKHFEVGTGTQVDYRYSQVRVVNAKNDIAQLEEDLIKIRRDFYEDFRIDLGGREIKKTELVISSSYINNIGERDLENIELQREQTKENYSYSRYENKWPDINAGTFWDTASDGWLVSLELNKTLFEYDDTSELYLVEEERLDVEYGKKENEVIGVRRDYENRYSSLVRERDNLQREQEVDEMKYTIYKLMYEQGTKSYIDYVEKYDDYVDTSIALEKKSNQLDALIYEIKYKN